MANKESENARAVAKEVIETIRKGEKVNFQIIQKKHGYSDTSAKSMKAKEALSYQKEMKPIKDELNDERDRLIKAIKKKDLSKLQYESAVRSLDILTKNIQLLSGKPTENIKQLLTNEQLDELIKRRKANNASREE